MKGNIERAGRNGRSASIPARLLCGASLTVVALIGLPSVAHAQQDRNWDPNGTAVNSGGTGTWNTSSNQWSPNADGVSGPYTPWNNAGIDNAIFGGPSGTNATVTLGVPITVHNLTVNTNTTYTLTGSTLTLAGATPTITTNGNAAIGSILAGNAGLTKAGAGALTLTGANIFSGGINVTAGTLSVSGDSSLGNASNGITLSSGAGLTSTGALNAGRVVTLLSGSSSIGGGVGSAHITGAGGFSLIAQTTLSDDTNDFTGQVATDSYNLYFTSIRNLGQASALGAATTVANGIVYVRNASAIYTGSGDTSNRGWSMGPFTGSVALRNQGTGTLTVTGDIAAGGGYTASVILDAQTADLALLGVISSNLTSFANRPFVFTGGGTSRSITLNNANTFGGGVTIQTVTVRANSLADQGTTSSLGTGVDAGTISLNSGTLSYIGTGSSTNRGFSVNGASSILNDGTGALNLSGASTFNPANPGDTLTLGGGFAGNNSLSGVISGNGNIVMNGAAGSTWLLSGTNTYVGTTTVTSGTLKAGSDQAFGAPNALVVNGGTLDFNTHNITAASLAGTGGSVALTGADLTVNGTTSTTYAGSITGTGGLIKRGTSTLTLTGQNTYTGATTVNSGTLALDFSAAGAPATNILSSASALNMTGGTLTLAGAAGAANGQTFNGLNVSAGNNRIVMTTGAGGSMLLDLGALNHTGGLLDFTKSATSDITTSNADGALGWATINGTDYAQVTGGHIVAFTTYAEKDNASTWLNGDVVADTGGAANTAFGNTVSGNVQLGGLKYTAAANSTVTVGAGNTLGVDGTILVASSIINASQTITGGSITGAAGGGTLGVLHNGTGTGTFTIASTIVDNGGATSFAKGGTGKVALTGANSYTGGTTLSGGTLAIDSVANGGLASSIGASSAASANLVIENGTLEYTGVGAGTTDRGFTLVNGGPLRTILVDSGNLSFGGVIVGADDAGFTKAGAGTLTLANAANTYTGVTTISAGTLSVNTLANGGVESGIGKSTADAANLVIQTGGTLQYTGATTSTDRGFTLNGTAGGTVDVTNAGTTLTVGGTIEGAVPFQKAGSGTLVFAGTNNNNGPTTINGGTLRAGSTQAFGGPNFMALADVAGVTLDLNGFNNKVGGLSGGGANGGTVRLGGATLTIGGTTTSFSGVITGAGGLTKDNSSTQTLVGCNNNYTGATSIVGGTLSVDCLANGGQASGIGASTSASANLVLSGGILAYTGGSTSIDRGITLGSTGVVSVTNAATVLGISGPIIGGGLRKDGAGTLVLSGNNTYNGITTVTGGILRAGSINGIGKGGFGLNDTAGVVLDLNNFNTAIGYLNGGGTTGGNVTLGAATLTIASNGGAGGYGGAISGSGGIVKGGTFTQALTGCGSSYTGSTEVRGGILQVGCLADGGTNSAIGASSSAAGNLLLNGGTLQYIGAAGSTNRLFALGGSAGSRLEASGTGAIVFTNIGAITFAAPGTAQTLALGGTNTGNNSLAAQITNNGAGVTSLIKDGAGTWILNNPSSSYTGITTINGGVLGVSKLSNGGVASSIGASSAAAANLVIGNGSTLRYTGTGDTTNRLFTLSAGTTFLESSGTGAVVFTDTGLVTLAGANLGRTIALGGTNTGNNTLAGSIGDAGTGVSVLAKNDAGTWLLTGNNSYTGNTNINAGTLVLGNGGTTGAIASATVNNLGTLGFNRSDTLTYGGVVTGTGAVQQLGTGTTVLTGDSNYSGGTTISAGTLQLGNGGTTGSITGNIVDNGRLAFNHGNVVTYAGVISGTGSVRQMGPSTLVLAGTNTYAGGTTIDGGGTLQISSDANLGDAAGGLTFNNGTLQLVAPIVTNRDITLAGAGTINVDTGFNAATTLALGGDITGPGSLTKDGLGTLTFTGNATHTGTTTVARGALLVGNGGTTGSIAGDIVVNAGTSVGFNRSDSYTYAGSISGAGAVSVIGGGIATFTGNSNYGGNTSITGNSELRVTAGNTVASGGATSINRGTLTVSGAGSTFQAGTISAVSPTGPAVVNVANGGVVRTTAGGMGLRGSGAPSAASLNITGTGSLVDLAGALTIASVGTTNTADMTISAGGTLRSTGANQIGAPGGNSATSTVTITGAGSNWTSTGSLAFTNNAFSVLAGGAASFASASIGTAPADTANLLVSGANSTFTTTGDLVLGDSTGTGIITLSDAAHLSVGGTFTLANVAGSTGVLNIGGAEGQAADAVGFYDAPTLAFGAGTGRLNFNHTETSYAFATAMSGTGTINQVAGVTNLTGNSAGFAGTTNVSGGTLRVNGTLGNASSVLNVLGGGTLGGAGTIGGNVSIANGGILAPGNSPGTMTIAGNLALSAGSILNFEFGQAGVAGGPLNDLVNVGGNLTLDGTINVTESAGGTFGAGIYRVFNYGGTLTDNGLTLGTLPAGSTVQVQTAVTGQVNLVNTAGLAFSFWDGAAGPKGNNVINGGTGTWHLAGADANWTYASGAANDAWSDGTKAIFAGTAGTVTVDNGLGAVTASGMQFATSGYVVDGAPLTLVGPQAAIQVGDGSAAGAGYTATISAVLTGNSQLVKTDLGTLVLTGASTYTGGTLISGGVLSVANDGLLGNGAVTIDGGTLQLTGANSANLRTYILGASGGAIDVTNAATANGVINALTGSGGLTKLGAGSFALNADNTYTGGTTISGGTLMIGAGGTTGSILGNVLDNGTLTFNRSNAYTYAGSITGTGSVSVTGTGVTTLTGNSNYGSGTRVTGTGGELRIVGGAIVTSGGSTTLGRSTLSIDGANTVFSTTAIGSINLAGTGSAIVNVTNGGTLRVTTGGVDIHALSPVSTQINITGANSLADVSGGIQGSTTFNGPFSMTIGAGGTLRTGGTSQIGTATSNTNPIAVAITGAGSNWTSTNSLLMTGGSFTVDQGGAASFTSATFGGAPQAAGLLVSGAASSFTTTGDLVIGSGTGTGVLTLTDSGHVTVGGNFVLADSATATGILNIGGAEGQAAAATGVFDAATLNLGSTTSRINFNHTDPDYVFATVMSGTGAVNQVAGTTTLTGANSYTGLTTVSGGTLLINGDQTAATAVTNVNAGALGGIGIIGGNVLVANGATLAPGDATGPGTLTINGNLGLSGGSSLAYDFGLSNVVGGPLNDLTKVGGDLTLDGTIDVTVSPGGSFGVGLYRVISYGGALDDQGLAIGAMPAGSNVLSQTSVLGQVNLVNIAGANVNFWDGVGARADGIVQGGSGFWQNGSGNDNWTLPDGSLNAPFQDGSFAIFAAAPGTVTVDNSLGQVTASGMQFASDGYVVTGQGIALVGPEAVIRVGDGTADGLNYTATIASDLTAAGDLVKSDLGTLVLTGTNSVAGDTYVTAGELRLADGSTLSGVGGYIGRDTGSHGTVTVTGTDGGGNASTWTTTGDLWIGSDGFGTLNIADGGKVVSNSGIVGANSGGGEVLVTGAGSTWENAGRISVGLFGTGTLRVEDGATVSSNDGIIGDSSQGDAVVTGAGTTWTNTTQLTVGSYSTGTLRIEDGASIVSDQGYIGAGAGSNGSVTVTGTGSNWLVSTSGITVGNNGIGSLSIEAGARVRAEGGVDLGVVAGSSGTLTLQGTAANRAVLETSGLTAGLGTVNLTLDGALLRATDNNGTFFSGFDGQDLTLGANGLAVDTDVYNIFVSPRFVGSGALIKDGAGALVLSGDNTYTGGTTINAGSLQLGVGGTTGSILGDVVNNGDLSFYRSDAVGFGGLISGSGSVTQFGPGTLTLTGTNSYTGATNVSNDGTLLINGDQSAATGLTTVATAATLGGTGIIGGSVDMTAGGTLAAGSNGAGTLTINGNLALGSGSQLAFELGQANTVGGALNDLVNVGGNLTLDGTLNVAQSAGGSFDIGIYRLFNYGGTLTDNGLTVGTLPAGGVGLVQTSVAGQVNLVNTAGLDLTFWDGDAGPKFNNIVDGGNGTWRATSGDNWTEITGAVNAAYSNGAIAIFSGTAGTVTVDNGLGAVTASGMQFATNGYVITGDAVTLTGAQATIRVGDGSAAGAGYTATIASALTGASQLVKTDLGTLVLTGTNSYSGGTAINAGTLQIGNGGATGSLTGDIANNGALAVNRAGTLTLDGAISGSGTLTKGGTGTLILSGTNSYAGGTTVGAGTLQVSSDANLGAVAGTLSLQGGTLQAGASFTSARGVLLGSPNSNSIDTQGFDVTLSGAIGNGPNNQAGNFLNKLGTGTLTLTGANTYANRTLIAGGTLALAGAGTIGAGNLIVSAGTVFDISQADTGARVIQLNSGHAGTIALGSKVLTLGLANSFSDWSGTIADGGIAGGTGGSVVIAAPNGAVRFFEANSYTGGTTVAGGTFVLAGNGSLYNGGAVTVNGGAAFDISGLTAGGTTIGDLGGAGALSLGGKTLTFGTANSTAFSGLVSGAGGALVKNGSGTFTLSGANSYTGTTDVNAGTLLVNGNQSAATGLTSVASGATLGGSGTIGGDVFVANGGTLSPGNSVGTLTINGNLALSGGSALAYEFGAANAVGSPLNDVVNIGGNLTLDGTINVAVTAGGAFDIGLYRIANYGGALTDNGLAIGTMPAGADVSVQTSVANQVNLINTGGATLNFWDGAAGPKFNGAVNGGDGVWQNGTGNNNWADVSGVVNAGYADGAFAIFTGAPGTVTIDNSLGAVTASGLQFAADGYTIAGDALTLTGPQSVIRVGDGTGAGAGYTATIAAGLTGASQLVKTDLGTLVLTGANSYTGGTAINRGTIRIASDANLGDAAGGLSLDGGTLNTTADLVSARAVTLAGSSAFLTDGGTTLTLGGAVSGVGGLTKGGTGTLMLTGTGSYAGATNVGAGTLLVNGDYAGATGATSIASGASLGGTGTIGGDVTLASGATLTPGAGGAGTLTIKGGLSLAAGTTLAYEFGQANATGGALNDLVKVGGDLTLDGTINVTTPTGGTFDAGIYRVFDYGGTLTNNGLTLGALPAGSNVAVQTSIAGQVNLVNFAGLTLNFWDGAAGPKNNGVINGGTGIWQNGTGTDNWTDAPGAINAAYSNGGFAVFSGTSGTVTVDNGAGQVTASGMQFAAGGYTITGGEVALTGPQATIRVGDGSTAGAGYTATINSVLSGATQLVKTDAGTLVLGGTNSYTGGTLINGGTVQISSDANLGAAAGTVTFDGGTLASTASLASARDFTVAGPGTFSTAGGTTLTLTGALSGTGDMTKTGAGTLVMTGNGSGYTGAVMVASGTFDVRGTLGSAATVAAGARLEGTGQLGSVTNRGTVAPGGDALGTLTLTGSYTGNGGTLEIGTALGDDASATDRLVIGGSTSGATEVILTNRGGLGAQTVEGIKIVDVTGASSGIFTLNGDYVFQGAQAVIAGAYGYRLYQGGVTSPTDGDWYLRSSLLNGGTPDTPDVPLYQPGVPIYEAYNQTLLTLTDLGTMQERVGNRQWARSDDGKAFGIWGRMQSNRSRPNAVRSTSLTDVNIDSWKMELGADHVLSARSDGATLVLGVIGGYGEANASIGSIYGNGSIKTRGYSAGATLSWFGPQGFYVDSRAQVTWFDSDLKSTVLGKLADGNNGTGQAYSFEIGKRASIGGHLSVTPQIQMVYSTVGFDRFTDPNDAQVSSKLGDSLKSRWGISLDRQDARSHLYGMANLSYEWLDGTVTDVSGTPLARENHRLWGELGLGGSVLLGDRLTLYSEASANTAVNDFGKSYSLKGTAGLRLAF